ncbi:hypothetical protein PAXRUDRAFT_135662, partial [Paxillus rubicundulus Ve08.2h10]
VHVHVEHAFAALKGCFQSLYELHLWMKIEDNLYIAVYWVAFPWKCIFCHHRFEGTMDWVITEGQEVDDGQGDQIYNQVGGTKGQRFHGHLMERLFEECGLQF